MRMCKNTQEVMCSDGITHIKLRDLSRLGAGCDNNIQVIRCKVQYFPRAQLEARPAGIARVLLM